MSIEDKIKALEEEIEKTKYNKATQHHIGKLKAKIAALKETQETRKRGSAKGLGFGIKKEGHATVVFVGLPSVGKSTLLNRLTNAESKVAAYEFTTLEVVPGMLHYGGVNIQLLDVPGLIVGAAGGKGRGREVLSMVRNADLALIVLDAKKLEVGEEIKNELEDIGIRLDKKKPDVTIEKLPRGGINITWTTKHTKLDNRAVMEILGTKSIHNANVIIKGDLTDDQLIDAIMDNRVYIPSIVVVNKADLEMPAKIPKDYLPISAEKDINLDKLRELIFTKLKFMRVYLRPQGSKADLEDPLILSEGSTIADMCTKLHKDFIKKFRYAMVWGKSVKHEGQRCGINHALKDKDIVTIVKEL
ncbi:MAG: GTP-binding protein [Candidatus Altiarchaeota archaeon]|nr:GTP-binding protein [Candidatus Altiarchaeota archaeon]